MDQDDSAAEVVDMKDALEMVLKQEEDAIAVLGAGDEENCTYSMGYMERQAVFSCLTCTPTNENPAGVCYACSLKCHHGHDVVELYTKRKFKCDCGNSKFAQLKCMLLEVKDQINKDNKYNHNFAGKYCTCGRPYPDPDEEVEDVMIQCILCEDWYHSRHLGALSPVEFSEMICDGCVKEHSFLHCYTEYSVEPSVTACKKKDESGKEDVDIGKSNEIVLTNEEKCLLSRLKLLKAEIEKDDLRVMFWSEGWRNKLCQCDKCLEMYSSKNIGFIISDVDTVAFYEKKGQENVQKVWEEAASKMSQMNRVQQIEIIQGFNELKSGLQDFFKGFKENDVVRKEDVESFFEDLNKRKRRRLEEGYGIPPDNCKM